MRKMGARLAIASILALALGWIGVWQDESPAAQKMEEAAQARRTPAEKRVRRLALPPRRPREQALRPSRLAGSRGGRGRGPQEAAEGACRAAGESADAAAAAGGEAATRPPKARAGVNPAPSGAAGASRARRPGSLLGLHFRARRRRARGRLQ